MTKRLHYESSPRLMCDAETFLQRTSTVLVEKSVEKIRINWLSL